jgi:SNF2 family DNA or RNA helicase
LKSECGLPSRNEYIVFCHLTDTQMALYDLYIRSCIAELKQQNERDEAATNESNLLQVISSMRKIVNHPYLFFSFHARKIEDKFKKNGRFGFECIKRMRVETLPAYKEFIKKKQQQTSSLHHQLLQPNTSAYEVHKRAEAALVFKDWQQSGKLTILVKFLDEWNREQASNKVLVFSQTKKILDLLELILAERSIVFCRMDGDVALKTRMDTIEHFNSVQSPNLSVFLLTTRVGGLGINLTSANKVVIFDPDWNPMVDV